MGGKYKWTKSRSSTIRKGECHMNERDMKPVSGIEQRRFVAFLRLLQPWAMAIVLALLIDVFLRSILAGLIPYDPPTFATPGTPILHGSQFHRARLGLLLVTPISLLCSIFLDRYALAFGSQDTTSQHTAAKDMSEGHEDSRQPWLELRPTFYLIRCPRYGTPNFSISITSFWSICMPVIHSC